MTGRDRESDVARAIAAHLRTANSGGIAGLLHPTVELVVDNGGDESLGASASGRLACADELTRLATRGPAAEFAIVSVNGDCGIVIHAGGVVRGVVALSVRDGLADALWAVVNPDKLDGWTGTTPVPR